MSYLSDAFKGDMLSSKPSARPVGEQADTIPDWIHEIIAAKNNGDAIDCRISIVGGSHWLPFDAKYEFVEAMQDMGKEVFRIRQQLQLEVGKRYRNRYNAPVEITGLNRDPLFSFVDSNGRMYTKQGYNEHREHNMLDLIEEFVGLVPDYTYYSLCKNGYLTEYSREYKQGHNLKLVYDGETDKLKEVEILK